MRRLVALLVLYMLLPIGAMAAEVRVEVGGKTIRADVFPHLSVPFADGVTALPNLEFANLIGYRPLLLDLYLPPGTGNHPLVIWVHGGGWNRGDARSSGAIIDFPASLALLASHGYAVASVNYRLSAEAHFPAQIRDVKAAIIFLRINAAKYHIDPARVLIWGGSAGGQLAALAATTCGVADYRPEPSTGRLSHAEILAAKTVDVSDCVQAAVIWYGAFDLGRLGDTNPDQYLGCAVKTCPAIVAEASPITHVSSTTPPMLLIHGLADTEISPDQSRAMAAKLKKAGVPVETLFIADVDHGFIGKTTEATRAATLQALKCTFDYIDGFFAGK